MSSFSFRNIFSSDDAELGSSATASDDGRAGQAPESPARGGGETVRSPEGRHRRILASELLPYIPKAIAAQSGIPMERELLVPLPADGSLDVKLSALYQSCPELFAAEITPLNDSVVTLPPRLAGEGEQEGSAVALKKPSLLGGFDAPEANPFWSPAEGAAKAAPGPGPASDVTASPPSETHSPFHVAPASPAESATKQPEGFDLSFAPFSAPAKASPANQVSDKEKGTGFFGFAEGTPATKPEAPKPSADFAGPGDFETIFSAAAKFDAALPAPSAEPEGPARDSKAPETPEESEGVWGAMFSGSAFEEGGKASEFASGSFEDPPFDSIGKLLEQGTAPATGFAPAGFAAPAPAPSKGDAGVSPAAKHEDSSGFAFAAGFSAFAPASADAPAKAGFSGPKPSEMAAPTPGDASAELFKGSPWSLHGTEEPAAPAETESHAFPPAPEANAGAPVSDPFAGFVGFQPESAPAKEPEAKPTEAPASAFGNGGADSIPADPFAAFAPASTTLPADAAEPAAEAPAAVEAPSVVEAPREAAATSAPASAPTEAPAPAAGSEDDESRDLELRAIFSTSERFTLSLVARRVVGLPGINSCSLSTPTKLVQASRREENRLGSEAREMVSTLRNLAKLTGLNEARTFTLQTDRGVLSLFLEGEHCVMVQQESSTFEPGVREKLILVARSLVKLRE